MNKLIRIIFFVLCLMLIVSCSTFSKNEGPMGLIAINEIGGKKINVSWKQTIKGKSCSRLYFIFPTGIDNVKPELAIQDAIKNYPDAIGLAEVRHKIENFIFFPFYTSSCSKVEGYLVVKDRN